MLKKERGFTLLNLVVVFISFLAVALILYGGVFWAICAGNYWYTEGGVLQELRIDHQNVTEIVKTTRNVFVDSVIMAKEDGVLHSYCLNSNVLFNYTFSDCK